MTRHSRRIASAPLGRRRPGGYPPVRWVDDERRARTRRLDRRIDRVICPGHVLRTPGWPTPVTPGVSHADLVLCGPALQESQILGRPAPAPVQRVWRRRRARVPSRFGCSQTFVSPAWPPTGTAQSWSATRMVANAVTTPSRLEQSSLHAHPPRTGDSAAVRLRARHTEISDPARLIITYAGTGQTAARDPVVPERDHPAVPIRLHTPILSSRRSPMRFQASWRPLPVATIVVGMLFMSLGATGEPGRKRPSCNRAHRASPAD